MNITHLLLVYSHIKKQLLNIIADIYKATILDIRIKRIEPDRIKVDVQVYKPIDKIYITVKLEGDDV